VGIAKALAAKNGYDLDSNQEVQHWAILIHFALISYLMNSQQVN